MTVRVGEHVIESVITRRSAEDMGLKKGDTVAAVIKATEVKLSKGSPAATMGVSDRLHPI